MPAVGDVVRALLKYPLVIVAIAHALASLLLAREVAAADIGTACCSDIENRIAELEATVAGKGSRKVSLQISGQVSHAIVGWRDGAETNAYVVENNTSQNRIGFQGSATIDGDWSAGWRLEFQPRAYRSSFANQLSLGASNGTRIEAYDTGSASIRHAHWIIASKTWGTVTVGRNFEAAFGTSTVNLVNPDGFAGLNGPGFANGGFFVRRAGTTGNTGLSALTWQNFAYIRNGDGPTPLDYAHTSSIVRYTSPFLLGTTGATGFQASANWGADDAWTAAIRHADKFGDFQTAAAFGFSRWLSLDRGMCTLGAVGHMPSGNPVIGSQNPQTDAGSNVSCYGFQASASVLHVPTGLYVSGGGAQMTDQNLPDAITARTSGAVRRGDDKSGAWWVQAGWQARLVPLGNTIFWGQRVEYNTGHGVTNSIIQTVAASDVVNTLGATAMLAGTSSVIWGGGISQEIAAASMTLYAGLHFYTTSGTLMDVATGVTRRAAPIEDMQVFYSGATIKF